MRSSCVLVLIYSFTLYSARYSCVSEVGCREGDNRAGPLQPDRNSWTPPQSSQRHSQISLLPLQTLPWRRLPGICRYVSDNPLLFTSAQACTSVHLVCRRWETLRERERACNRSSPVICISGFQPFMTTSDPSKLCNSYLYVFVITGNCCVRAVRQFILNVDFPSHCFIWRICIGLKRWHIQYFTGKNLI